MKKIILSMLIGLSLASCSKENVDSAIPEMPAKDYHLSAPTQYVSADGIEFAYRVLGTHDGTPLVMLSSLGSSMDDWDPAVTNGFAQDHKVIIFDIGGVGASSGKTPDNIADMAKQTVSFIKALGYDKVDLMGFSMGSFIGQQIVLTNEKMVNKLILTGTGPKGSEGLSKLPDLLAASAGLSPEASFLRFGFTESAASQSAGKEAYNRIHKRKEGRDPDISQESSFAELQAVLNWAKPYPNALEELKAVSLPVLIFQGEKDLPVPVINARRVAKSFPNARLMVYADAGHAAIFQNAADFTKTAGAFLDE